MRSETKKQVKVVQASTAAQFQEELNRAERSMIYTRDPDRITPIEETEPCPEPEDMADWLRDYYRDKEDMKRKKGGETVAQGKQLERMPTSLYLARWVKDQANEMARDDNRSLSNWTENLILREIDRRKGIGDAAEPK